MRCGAIYVLQLKWFKCLIAGWPQLQPLMVLQTSCSVSVPCAGSSVLEAGCLGSFSWLWAAARWSTAALRPPSLWPWYPETRYPPGQREKRQSTGRRARIDVQISNNSKILKEECEYYLRSIRQSGYELWCHPVRCSNQRLPSLHFLRHLSTETKVWQLHLEADKEIKRGNINVKITESAQQSDHEVFYVTFICVVL